MDQSKSYLEECVAILQDAFQFLKGTTIRERAEFMYAVANKIEALDEALLEIANKETNLPLARLIGEKARTVLQWRLYADALSTGIYTEARIDLSNSETTKNDVRKYNVGIGPVLVFGASNFPFAFSTGGGDTASAIAAGCPVIVKGHQGHVETSRIMAETIASVVKDFGWPLGIFIHVIGNNVEGTDIRIGAYLTAHSVIKAVGFTGSFAGGKALFDIANQRGEPIPVFAEMGSVNPVFAFSRKLNQSASLLAKEYATSLTLGVGQFCTNPGIFIAVKGADFDLFKESLIEEIKRVLPAAMLNSGICMHYEKGSSFLKEQGGVSILAESTTEALEGQAKPIVVQTSGDSFLKNPFLSEEVFGPFAVLVEASSYEQVLEIAHNLKGQLTITMAATKEDIVEHNDIYNIVKDKAGRLLFNGMPTGVEVVYAMQHGGPFPSCTDSRFTSVGPDAVKRFVRPLAFQNWLNDLLPEELKNENSLAISRIVDGVSTVRNL